MSELLSKYDVFPENINEEFPLLDIGPSKKTLDPNVFAFVGLIGILIVWNLLTSK